MALVARHNNKMAHNNNIMDELINQFDELETEIVMHGKDIYGYTTQLELIEQRLQLIEEELDTKRFQLDEISEDSPLVNQSPEGQPPQSSDESKSNYDSIASEGQRQPQPQRSGEKFQSNYDSIASDIHRLESNHRCDMEKFARVDKSRNESKIAKLLTETELKGVEIELDNVGINIRIRNTINMIDYENRREKSLFPNATIHPWDNGSEESYFEYYEEEL